MKLDYKHQASTLEQALANLNEQSSLVFEPQADTPVSASADFYVNRPDNPLDELKTYLLHSPADDKILFSGHLGSGKSTELNRFAADREIKSRFLIIKYSISQVLNILDIDYIDFLLSFAACLYTLSSESGIEFDTSTLNLIGKWIKFFKGDDKNLENLDSGESKKEKIYNFFKGITSILIRELTLRESVRSAIKRNINQLVNVINNLVTHINTSLPGDKALLIIIDDLEKIPDVTRADQLFIQAGTYMATPKCKIIYTVPIALYYSLRFQQLANVFGSSFLLPNIKVREKGNGGPIDPSGCMKEFLKRRMQEGLIDADALERAIENSGGVAREFVRILKMACNKALTQNRQRISSDIVSAVVMDLRSEYARGMEKRHFQVLEAVAKGEPIEDQETLMELFHSRVVLEYRNGENWTAINPIVRPLLKTKS